MNDPRPLPPRFARLHARLRAHPAAARFTLANRLLLAMAFLPTGMVKVLGQRFTLLPLESPVGFFFEAMYRTGPWWHFIGAVQVVAAVCLLVPSVAILGALLFLPIGISILLITWGVGFQGTVWVAWGMVLSVTYLLCWDADRIWDAGGRLLGGRRGPGLLEGAHPVELLGWATGGVAGMGLFLTTRNLVPAGWLVPLVIAGAAGAGMVVVGWLLTALKR